MQQKKSLEILNYFKSVGVVVCLMESAVDKRLGVKNRQIQKLRDIKLQGVSAVLLHVKQLRNSLVHEPYDKDAISGHLLKIDEAEMVSFIYQLSNYLDIDISMSYAEEVVQNLYSFIR